MPKISGPRFVAEALRGYGVTHIFFVPQMLLETLTSMEGMGIRRVMTHGEKSAAYMADGYARASGKPGVCMAQHVGSSNLAAGLKDAYLTCSPVIALTGGPTPLARHRHAYQELEDFTQFEPTTKFNAHVDHIARLPDMLRQAFAKASATQLYVYARGLQRAGDAKRAFEIYPQVAKRDPNHWLSHLAQARLASHTGDYASASKEMKMAIAGAPDVNKPFLEPMLAKLETKTDINN